MGPRAGGLGGGILAAPSAIRIASDSRRSSRSNLAANGGPPGDRAAACRAAPAAFGPSAGGLGVWPARSPAAVLARLAVIGQTSLAAGRNAGPGSPEFGGPGRR